MLAAAPSHREARSPGRFAGLFRAWVTVFTSTAMLVLVLFGGTASAATATITVSPATVPVGGVITISGVVPTSGSTLCPPGPATIVATTALFPQGGFGPQAARDSAGAFSVTYQVPTSTPPGTYALGLRCGGGNVGVSTNLTVTGQVQQVPTGAPQAGLGGASRDGAPRGWIVAGVAAALLAGSCLALSFRRRRHARA